MRWVARVGGAFVGSLLIFGLLYVVKVAMKNDTGRRRVTGALEATSQLRSQLGRDAHVKFRVLDDNGTEDDLELTVVYPASTPQPERKDLYASTNIIVRRHVPNVRDVKIVFGDDTLEDLTPALIDAGELPPAAAATPVPINPNVVAPAPAPAPPPALSAVAPAPSPASATATTKKPTGRKGPTGTVTLVTFPEAKVVLGRDTLGTTPLFNFELPVGTHLLSLVGEDGARHRLSLPVKAGKNAPVKVNLSDLPTK